MLSLSSSEQNISIHSSSWDKQQLTHWFLELDGVLNRGFDVGLVEALQMLKIKLLYCETHNNELTEVEEEADDCFVSMSNEKIDLEVELGCLWTEVSCLKDKLLHFFNMASSGLRKMLYIMI